MFDLKTATVETATAERDYLNRRVAKLTARIAELESGAKSITAPSREIAFCKQSLSEVEHEVRMLDQYLAE